MAIIRARQRTLTGVFPHNANRRFIVPNRKGQASNPNTLLAGLVGNADVNTNGRADNLPFDWIENAVGVPTGAPTVTTGDGGYSGMVFNGTNEVAIKAPDPAWSGAGFTLAYRARVDAPATKSPFLTFEASTDAALLISNFLGRDAGDPDAEAYYQSGAGVFSDAQSTGLDFADSLEHVFMVRCNPLDGTIQLGVDGVLVGSDVGNFRGPGDYDEERWGRYTNLDAAAATGTMFWSAVWARYLTNDETQALDDVPNPFGRLPT